MFAGLAGLLARRVILALTVLPPAGIWLAIAIIFLLVSGACIGIGFKRRFLQVERLPLSAKNVLDYALVPVFGPSLVEELAYRVLLLPRTDEAGDAFTRVACIVLSITVFVLCHPLRYYLMPSKRSLTFIDPTLLMLATVLGAGCTVAFLVSESLWPPLLVHYFCVVGWLWFLGGARRLSGNWYS